MMTHTGTWRDTLVCHNEQLLAVPVTLPVHLAATLMVNPSTAYRMISDFVELKQGVVVLFMWYACVCVSPPPICIIIVCSVCVGVYLCMCESVCLSTECMSIVYCMIL